MAFVRLLGIQVQWSHGDDDTAVTSTLSCSVTSSAACVTHALNTACAITLMCCKVQVVCQEKTIF